MTEFAVLGMVLAVLVTAMVAGILVGLRQLLGSQREAMDRLMASNRLLTEALLTHFDKEAGTLLAQLQAMGLRDGDDVVETEPEPRRRRI